jgi:hypothetical protein
VSASLLCTSSQVIDGSVSGRSRTQHKSIVDSV